MGTSWQLGPVMRRTGRHRGAVIFVALQLGIGLAIAVLAVLIGDYFVSINRLPSGFAESELTVVHVQLSREGDVAARRAAILDSVARAPGSTGATVLGQRRDFTDADVQNRDVAAALISPELHRVLARAVERGGRTDDGGQREVLLQAEVRTELDRFGDR